MIYIYIDSGKLFVDVGTQNVLLHIHLTGYSSYTSSPNSPAIMSSQSKDDSFELYDLRVEVVNPPGERIMCGAKVGDFFTLEGEMLYLPPGQGISIYSLGESLL